MVASTTYQQAVEAFAQEQYTQAAQLFAQLVANRPDDASLRLWLASAQQQIGEQTQAREQYELILNLPTSSEIRHTAQRGLRRLGVDPADIPTSTLPAEVAQPPIVVIKSAPQPVVPPKKSRDQASTRPLMAPPPLMADQNTVLDQILDISEVNRIVQEVRQQSVQLALPLIALPAAAGLIGFFLLSQYWAIYLGLQLLSVVAAVALSGGVGRKVAAPMQELVTQTQLLLANYNLGTLQQVQAQEQLQQEIKQLSDEINDVTQGNLTVEATTPTGALGEVATAFNTAIEKMRQLVSQVQTTGLRIKSTALSNAAATQLLATAAQEQAQKTASRAQSLSKMNVSLLHVVSQAQTAQRTAEQVSDQADQGNQAVNQALNEWLSLRETMTDGEKKVKRLAAATQDMAKIVALVNQLSMRANLLVLKASVEAQKEGAPGADTDIQNFANLASGATRQIEQVVLNIQNETGAIMNAITLGASQVSQGTSITQTSQAQLSKMLQTARQLQALVSDINTVTTRQQSLVQDAAQVIRNVENTAQNAARQALQVSGSLQELATAAAMLEQTVQEFRVDKESTQD